ncbi:MFS transporter [Candidatus Woesearchaeota archaeon]|nr:MFS transporter [Candidatus Woesearchaeota archaeon]
MTALVLTRYMIIKPIVNRKSLFPKKRENTEEKIKKSLVYSTLDASFWAAMVGFGESFFSAFATFLKASNFQLGLLGSLPQALGSVFQLFSDRLLKFFNSRKKFVSILVLLQALMYLPIALVFFFGNLDVYFLILLICLYFIFGMIIGPSWSSWMGDLVSEEFRGTYFSRRNTIAGYVSFFSLLIAGYLLERFTGETKTQYIGFLIIFILALLFRFVSFLYICAKYEPNYIHYEDNKSGFIDFLRNAGSRNYGIFIIFLCLMNFSIFIAGPFFAGYMFYDLKLSYARYTILIAAATLAKYFSLPVWGKAVDKYGTRKILTLSGYLMPAISLLWVFSPNFSYLIFVQIYGGFVWAGFEIAAFNFFFDTIIPQKRAKYIAYSNVLNGIFLFLGAMSGGLIVKYNSLFASQYLLVFLLSGIFRYAVSFTFIPKLKEVRIVEHISYSKLFLNILTDTTTRGLVYDLIKSRKKKNF